jgi:hypothetical protein
MLLLALTASRHNFPLRVSPPFPLTKTQQSQVGAHSPTKKHEGVVPSRRHVESRRAEWVRSLALSADFNPLVRSTLEHQDEFARHFGHLHEKILDRRVDATTPGYLLAFLTPQQSRTLPPPA